jgi:uncharacterized protein involved in exopolysaccharide biosynthesis
MAVTGEAEPKPLLTLLSGLRSAVVARWRLALLIFAGLVGAGMTVTLMTPPSYESSIKILVARERVDPRVSPGAVSGEMPRAEISEEEFNSEMEIVRSREVVEAVAKVRRPRCAPGSSASSARAPARRGGPRSWIAPPRRSPGI